MPKVGSKHFAYTKKGATQAKQHAAKTGQAVQHGDQLGQAKERTQPKWR